MAEHAHHIRKKHCSVAGVIYIYVFICTIEILARSYSKVKRSGLVDGILHLIDMPVRSEQRSIADTHVRTNILHLLGIPQREGVVVAMSYKDSVFSDRVEVVLRHLDCCVTVASVVVVPVLGSHQRRHAQEGSGHSRSHSHLTDLSLAFLVATSLLDP